MGATLILGSGGLLGQAMAEVFADGPVSGLGRDALRPDRFDGLRRRIEAAAPALIVNCAADTRVDAAESEPEPAMSANAALPGVLAQAAREAGALLIQISSTGCYGDWKEEPYVEADPLRPTTVHHRSKAQGEAAVQASGCEHLILRAGWLYSDVRQDRRNFVWARLLEASGADRMRSDPGQRGCPTCVADLARQARGLVERGERGVFNVVAQGCARRLDYVQAIIEGAGLPVAVEAAASRFERPARVSPNECAVNARLQAVGLDLMPDWRPAVAAAAAGLASRLGPQSV